MKTITDIVVLLRNAIRTECPEVDDLLVICLEATENPSKVRKACQDAAGLREVVFWARLPDGTELLSYPYYDADFRQVPGEQIVVTGDRDKVATLAKLMEKYGAEIKGIPDE